MKFLRLLAGLLLTAVLGFGANTPINNPVFSGIFNVNGVSSYSGQIPSTAISGLNSGTVSTISVVSANGVSATITNPTTTPALAFTLGAITPTTVNGLTISSTTGTFTLMSAKVLSVTNTLTLSGTDSTVMTFPSTTATIARTDAAQTFTGASTGTSWTLTTTVLAGGLTASGAGANDFSGSSGTFKTSTGANTLGGASSITNIPGITSASSATTGALTIGNGTAATNVGIGGGNVNAGGSGTFGGVLNVGGVLSALGFKASKVTATSGFISAADEGANVYNVFSSRNNADSAYLALVIRSNGVSVDNSLGITGNVAIGAGVNALYGFYNSSSVVGNGAMSNLLAGTLTASANGDTLYGSLTTGTIAKGAFTGLVTYSAYLGTPSTSGAGTIATHAMLRIDAAPTATSRFGIWQVGTDVNYFGGKFVGYNNVALAGEGIPNIRAFANITAQSSNATITSYANPAADGDYEVSAQMSVTASTVLTTTLTVTYTDVANVARTMILPIQSVAGSFIAAGAITGAGASIWESPVMHIRVKASTTITILTSAGTFTGVTYSASGVIKKTS